MTKLTFKQYLDSKEQLRKAIANTPISIVEYEVCKYCALPIGEAEEDKQLLGLKPKHRIIVEWCYDIIDNPTPTNIQIVGSSTINETDKFPTFWPGSKLKKWLDRHTTEHSPTQYGK